MAVTLTEFQNFLDNPPPALARVAFMFRQAQAKRTQMEGQLSAARKSVETAEAALSEATGYQKALQDVIAFEIERVRQGEPVSTPAPSTEVPTEPEPNGVAP